MEPITYNIRLDTSQAGVQATLNAKRGDARVRRVIVHLYSGATPYSLPETGVTATLWANKPDGTRVFKYAETDGDKLVVTLTSQMLAAVGLVSCELQVMGADGAFLTTPRFDISVEDALMNDEELESTDELTVLVEALTRVEQIEEQEQSRIDAETLRVEAETARAEAETARDEAEQRRITAESGRVDAEAARAEAEAERTEAEVERVLNEAGRVEAEESRITAESGRVAAESEREENVGAAVEAATEAAKNASAAAESAGAATDAAELAADRANAAAEACEDIAGGVTGTWDSLVGKPDTFPPSPHNHQIADVLGLTDELNTKAGTDSPVFTGAPEAPTAEAGSSTAQIATTAFVQTALSSKANAVKTVAATLTAADWTGDAAPYEQAVEAAGVTADSAGSVGVADGATDEQYEAAMKAQLRKTAQGENSLTIKAYGTKPTVDIPIAVQII